MRKKLLTMLSMVMALALSLALCVSNVFAAEADPVDLDKDAANWMWLYNLEITEDGLKTTDKQYCAASQQVAASAKINVVEDARMTSASWGRHAIMFKVNDPNVFLWEPSQTTSSGDWLAVAMCSDTSSLAIYECKDGVVSVVAEKTGVSGYDNWFLHKQHNTWEIEYKDVADGVEVTASFTATDGIGNTPTGTTYTVSYKSTNTALHGKGSIAINRAAGDGVVSEDNFSLINVDITEIVTEAPVDPEVPEESEETPVEPVEGLYSSDADKWSSLTGVTVSDAGMVSNATGVKAVTNDIGGNSTVDITIDSPTTNGTWQYEWIMLKTANPDKAWSPVANASVATSSVGDWLGLSFGGSSGNLFVVESNDGVITMKPIYSVQNASHWYSDEQVTNIIITTTDTDEGVTLDVTFTVSDCANASAIEDTYTFTYKSTNTRLWGEQKVLIGHNGANTNPITYTVVVDDVASDYIYEAPEVPEEPEDYGLASDPANWELLSGVAIADGIMRSTTNNVRATSVAVGGNSTLDILLDSSSNAFDNGGWGYDWVLFKADGSFVDANDLSNATGNWLGLIYGASYGKVDIIECVDGVVTKKDMSGLISGYDNWYSRAQKTNIIITTTDTDDGVEVSIHFEVTDPQHSSPVKAGGYDFIYTSTNKKLWGEQKVVFGSLCSINPTATTGYVFGLRVDDVASDYSYDRLIAQGAKDLIAALTVDVNLENYADVNAAYVAANAAFVALTDAQKVFVTEDELQLLADCKATLDVVAREIALSELAAKIDALPTEITLENYADAKAAIEEAETLFASLSEDEKATIENSHVLLTIGEALDVFEANMAAAQPVVALIAELPVEVNRINYNASLVATINGAKDAYDSLADEVKIHVSNVDMLTVALEALANYEATLVEPDFDPDNLAQNVNMWSKSGNANASCVTFDNYGMALHGSTDLHKSMLIKDNVKANSTISVVFDAQTTTSWGQSYVMFKNKVSADLLDAGAPIIAVDHGGVPGAPSGTWMAFMFGNSSAMYFTYCVDGVLTTVMASDVPGTEYNKAHLQISYVTITTVDTETGVEVTIKFRAEGIDGITGEEYTLTFNVEETVFHGAGAVSVGTYNGSGEGEKVLVKEVKVTNPDGDPFEARVLGNEVNFATDRKYWKDIANPAGFEFTPNGAELWEVKTGGLLLNQKVKDQQTVKVALDSTLTRTSGSYGNVYFIIRSKESTLLYNGSHFPQVMGDYIVLAVGADGIKIFECANGEMLHGAKLLPTGAIEGGYDLSAGTNGNDIWYIYDNYTKLDFYTEDIDDGVDVYITLYAPSGKTYLFNYFSENTALQGDCYFGIEYFLFAPGSSDGLMKLESLRIDGVEEGFVPDVDVAALNASMITVASTAITAANVEDIAAAYAEFNAVYESLNFDMLKDFNMNALKSIEANLVAFEKEIADIEAIIEAIDALPTEVTPDTYDAVAAAYASAKAKYDALTPNGKANVTNKSKLDALATALEALEIDLDAAAAFDALVNAIPELTDDNRADVVAAIELAEQAYAGLTDAQKALTTKYEDLAQIRESLPEDKPTESEPESEVESTPETSEESEEEEKPVQKGCLGGISGVSFLALAGLVAVKRLRKRG